MVVFGKGTRLESPPPHVFQDGMDHIVVEDEGEDAHRSTTAGTSQGIDLEDALQELGPASAPGLQRRPGGELRILAFLGEGPVLGENAQAAPVGLRRTE